MTPEEYYTAPPDHVFEEIRQAAIKIWQEYDDTYGYATGKIETIRNIGNVQDNAWFIVAMFDARNITKLLDMVSDETAAMIRDAIEN